MAFNRKASAVWNGTGKEGTGKITSTSGVLKDTPYSFAARFVSEDGKMGTNPEELIAAAHSACFTMALSFQLNGAGFTATELKTDATVTIEKVDNANKITGINLEVLGNIPGISNDQFQELANNAKKGCPGFSGFIGGTYQPDGEVGVTTSPRPHSRPRVFVSVESCAPTL